MARCLFAVRWYVLAPSRSQFALIHFWVSARSHICDEVPLSAFSFSPVPLLSPPPIRSSLHRAFVAHLLARVMCWSSGWRGPQRGNSCWAQMAPFTSMVVGSRLQIIHWHCCPVLVNYIFIGLKFRKKRKESQELLMKAAWCFLMDSMFDFWGLEKLFCNTPLLTMWKKVLKTQFCPKGRAL